VAADILKGDIPAVDATPQTLHFRCTFIDHPDGALLIGMNPEGA
jgi:hypothetical protein